MVAESAASYIRRGRENRSARLNEMLLSWKRRIDPCVQAAWWRGGACPRAAGLKAGSPGRANASQPDAIIHQFPEGARSPLNKHVGYGGARAFSGARGSSGGDSTGGEIMKQQNHAALLPGNICSDPERL